MDAICLTSFNESSSSGFSKVLWTTSRCLTYSTNRWCSLVCWWYMQRCMQDSSYYSLMNQVCATVCNESLSDGLDTEHHVMKLSRRLCLFIMWWNLVPDCASWILNVSICHHTTWKITLMHTCCSYVYLRNSTSTPIPIQIVSRSARACKHESRLDIAV